MLDIFVPRGPSTETIAKSAIAKFSDNMIREIAPWTATEERRISKSKSKDRRFRDTLELLENLNRRISETGIDTPPFVTNEIDKVR